MKLYDESVINVWSSLFKLDKYDDVIQREQYKEKFAKGSEESQRLFNFVARNLKETSRQKILDIGCGGGLSFEMFPITHGIEPGDIRYAKAVKYADANDVIVVQGVAEAIPFPDKMFDAVLSLNAIEHARSDYEVMIEVNRVLKMGGMFILTYQDAREKFVAPTGRTYNGDHLVDRMKDYGFGLVEKRYYPGGSWGSGIAVEKLKDFDVKDLLKVQHVKRGKLWEIRNLIEPSL